MLRQPLQSFIGVYCDMSRVPYKLRQKLSHVQHLLIDIFHTGCVRYKLCLFEDGLILLNTLTNKVIWETDWFNYNLPTLLTLLSGIQRLYDYEINKILIKTVVARNDYLTLRQKYESYE